MLVSGRVQYTTTTTWQLLLFSTPQKGLPGKRRPAWTGRVLLCSRMPRTPPQPGVDPVVYSAAVPVISGDEVGNESTGCSHTLSRGKLIFMFRF